MAPITKESVFGTCFRIYLVVSCLLATLEGGSAQWPSHGGNLANTRSPIFPQPSINPWNISSLTLRWKFFVGDDITATPAVWSGDVYFPAWDGNLYAVNELTGEPIWKKNLGQLTGLTPDANVTNVTLSRTTPVVAGDLLIVGIFGPATVIAVKRSTGELVWTTELDPHPLALITMSGTAYLDAVYVGVSSLEERLPAGQCCTFRGSLAKLELKTGKILWQTYTLPDNHGELGGYAGAAIWGSSPSIDIFRNLVYVGTGNLYIAPAAVLECQAKQNNQTTKPTHPDQCIAPDAHYDSVLAIDMGTGNIKWYRQLGGYDVFYLVCLVPNNPSCPPGPNLDADFGEAPMLLTIFNNGTYRDVVALVQKSGFAWALDRNNGDIIWFTLAGPGGTEGGGTWGAATDGKRIYTNIVNNRRVSFTLAPSTATTTAGAWVALDANTGQILWSTANPSNDTANAPVTLVNGVLFAGSIVPTGPFYGIDAETGKVIWTYITGATIYGGASSSNGCVYIGHGYTFYAIYHPTWTRGKYLFAFCA